MVRILAAAGLAACFTTASCSSTAEPSQPARHSLRLAKTTVNELGAAFARLPDVKMEIATEGGSSITSLIDLQRQKIDISIPLADVAYLAYAGQLAELPEPFEQLRGMAVIGLNTIHFLAGPGSRVTKVPDLKGLHVSQGAPGSSLSLITPRLFEAHGIHPNDVHAERIPNNELVNRLASRKIDAAFSAFTVPSNQVIAAMKAGARLIEVAGPAVEEMRTRYPYLKRTLIPAGTYPNQTEPIRTIGVDLAVVCRADLDDDLVYRLLDAYFATFPPMTPPNIERAPATPVPLHTGAARYYRQRELAK